jgi:hypothetical protein
VGRGDHVTVGEGAADADRDGLLSDCDVQEPGQLAGAEALLDLFLEAPDQEHLPEKLAQGLFRDPAALLDSRHGRDSTLHAMALVEQFGELVQGLPDDWQSARLRLTVPDDADCSRAAALLGPTNPGRHGKVIDFATARRGIGVGADRIRDLLRRLDREGIEGELELVGVEEAPTAADVGRAGLRRTGATCTRRRSSRRATTSSRRRCG